MRRIFWSTTLLASLGLALPGQVLGQTDGFSISIDGRQVAGEARVAEARQRADARIEAVSLDVRMGGIGIAPELGFVLRPVAGAAGVVEVRSAMNYPAFVGRGEIRVMRADGAGRVETVAVHPVAPNGTARIALPEGDGVLLAYRVYDGAGRFDETEALTLAEADRRALSGAAPAVFRQRIPVRGGVVTVTGDGVGPGAAVSTLGETVRADASGRFAVERILPPGRYAIPVAISGGPSMTREIVVPERDVFGVGVVDVTAGWREIGDTGRDSYVEGRLSGYFKMRTAGGVTVTGSVDTEDRELEDLFSLTDDKTPSGVLRRLDPTEFYPTYGDDSFAFDDAPTDGPLYLRVEKDGNFAMWGTARAPLSGGHYLRNERVLYGFHGLYRTDDVTAAGEARTTVQAYASEPDRLPGRDVFRGTGGSLFLLSRQDISVGTEVIRVEVRDGVTNRLVSSAPLVAGQDYEINYLQGTVVLTRPLSGFVAAGPVSGDPGTDAYANLTVSYEYTPAGGDIDGMALGGRVETWVSDRVRLGVTAQVERTATADQTAESVDLLFRHSDQTEMRLEIARSEGPGFGSTFSADGGLTVTTGSAGGGTGEAVRFEGRAALADLGLGSDGSVSGYFERRTEGFTTLDEVVTATTGDETLFGLGVEMPVSPRATLSFALDGYENRAGEHEHVASAEWVTRTAPGAELSFAVEHVDRDRDGEGGSRTDVALRLTREVSDDLEWYVFGQATLARDGLGENHRVGAGGRVGTDSGWALSGEVSAGSTGPGARVVAERTTAGGGLAWAGYELEPGREISGVLLDGRDHGRLVFGGRQPVGDRLTVYGETSYDLFGSRRSVLSRYGVDVEQSARLSYGVALEVGTLRDPADVDIDRRGLSFGLRYDDGERWRTSTRLEFRRDERDGGLSGDAETFLVSFDGQRKIDDARRLVFSLKHAETDADGVSVAEGRLTDLSMGFALRPVAEDRFNLLARYRYLYDDYGQRVDGVDTPGPRQRSHVVSVDGEYQMTERWSVGAKVGARLSETAADTVSPFVPNDAWLAVATGRFHATKAWDVLLEYRVFEATDAGYSEDGALAAIYRHVGDHVKVGVGYNFTTFSDDLTDLTRDDKGLFLNVIAKF